MNIQFDGRQYVVDGKQLIRVTAPLRDLKGLEHVPDKTLNRARDVGKNADKAVMLYVDDNLDEDQLDPVLVPYLTGWKKAVARYGIRVIHKQRRVCNLTYGYAGTLDLIIDMDRRPSHVRGSGLFVAEIKCTSDVDDEVALQLVAYQEAYNYEIDKDVSRFREPRVRHRVAFQLFDDGDFKPHWFTDRSDFMSYVGCLARHKWLLKTGRIKPNDD